MFPVRQYTLDEFDDLNEETPSTKMSLKTPGLRVRQYTVDEFDDLFQIFVETPSTKMSLRPPGLDEFDDLYEETPSTKVVDARAEHANVRAEARHEQLLARLKSTDCYDNLFAETQSTKVVGSEVLSSLRPERANVHAETGPELARLKRRDSSYNNLFVKTDWLFGSTEVDSDLANANVRPELAGLREKSLVSKGLQSLKSLEISDRLRRPPVTMVHVYFLRPTVTEL